MAQSVARCYLSILVKPKSSARILNSFGIFLLLFASAIFLLEIMVSESVQGEPMTLKALASIVAQLGRRIKRFRRAMRDSHKALRDDMEITKARVAKLEKKVGRVRRQLSDVLFRDMIRDQFDADAY